MKSFINCGNLFSKAGIISTNFENNSIIFSIGESINKLKDILGFLKTDFVKLECFSQLVDFIYNENGNYIVNYKLLQTKNLNLYQIEQKKSFVLNVGEHFFIEDICKKLNELGYIYSQYIGDDIIPETSVFNKLGDIITIKLKNSKNLIKISFFGNEIESIFSNKQLKNIRIGEVFSLDNIEILEGLNTELVEMFSKKYCIFDNIDIYFPDIIDNFSKGLSLDILKTTSYNQTNLEIKDLIIDNLENLTQIIKNKNTKIYTTNQVAIQNYLDYNNLSTTLIKTNLKYLSSYLTLENYVICDDILSKIFVKKRVKKSLGDNIDLLLTIKPGDFVVHIEHGIGVFNQIITKEIGNSKSEYIEIEYKNNDKLYVPIIEVRRLSKYIGTTNPKLTALSTKEWSKKLEKAGVDAEAVAQELLELYAKRQTQKGFSFAIDKQKAKEFIDSFEYPYTRDQESSVFDILGDMSKEIPMDRVLVGDVGFGKTEIAFNAIFHAFLNKKQSILISPLVVLAYQHYNKALERFANFGLKIEILTRYETPEASKRVLDKLKSGEIDLVIGTHRLLGDKVIYKNLGLLIVDEEHKFGVLQKEKIKKISTSIDILSMSATPIPRSLNMALSGIRDISILSTPPDVRKGVETFVSNYSQSIIKEAGTKEFERGGQIFFIHNRVATIDKMQEEIQEIFPDKKIIITHGQLDGNDLEDRIMAFKRKEYDILLSSTVIENGVDFPNVNTIFINDAYKFGISQIHQLRGRVGRSDRKGYCYLMFNREKLTPDAAKRLQTVVDYSHLGAGFELAMKDLEIRGGGDILGVKQSGNVFDIGVSTYLKMLQDKVLNLKETYLGETKKVMSEVKIDLNIQVFIDDECFSSNLDKINFYREIEYVDNLDDLDEMIASFIEINPILPTESHNLFKLLKVKIKSSYYKITSIKRNGLSYEINFLDNLQIDELKAFLDMDKQVNFVVKDLHQLKVPVMKFKNDTDFLNYLYSMFFENKILNKKIKLKK